MGAQAPTIEMVHAVGAQDLTIEMVHTVGAQALTVESVHAVGDPQRGGMLCGLVLLPLP